MNRDEGSSQLSHAYNKLFAAAATSSSRGVWNRMKISDIGFLKTELNWPQNSKTKNSVSADRFSKNRLRQRTEVNHVILKKATVVGEMSTIISTLSRLFFDEFLRFNITNNIDVWLASWSVDTVAGETTTTNFTNPTTVTQNDQDRASSAVKAKPAQIGDVRVDNKVQTCATNRQWFLAIVKSQRYTTDKQSLSRCIII